MRRIVLLGRRIRSTQFNPGAEGTAADLALVLVGGRNLGTLSETGKARTTYHGLARKRFARLDGQRAMSGSMLASQVPDYSVDTDLVIPEQAPIRVFTDEGGVIVINQHQWRESEDEVYILFRPEHAAALCRAILKEAGIDPNARGPAVTAKDGTAKERQRRRREKLRDSHAQSNVTVTAELANDIDEPTKKVVLRPPAD